MPNKIKRRLKDFDFSSEDAHVALVHQVQGGPANEFATVIYKAADTVAEDLSEVAKAINEVQVTMPFDEFLRRFMGMYWDESIALASLLGYSPEMDDWDREWIDSKLEAVTLLKQAEKEQDLDGWAQSLSLVDGLSVLKAQELFEKGLQDSSSDTSLEGNAEEGELNKSLSQSMSEDKTDNKGENSRMSTVSELLDSEEGKLAIQKAAEELKESEALAELEKARGELEELRKAKEQADKAEVVELVKGYSFIDEADQDSVVGFLLKAREIEGALPMLVALEKANKIVEQFGEAVGFDGEGQEASLEENSKSDLHKGVSELIKSRKNK